MAVTKGTTKTAADASKEVKAREDEMKKDANVTPVESADGFSPSGAPRQVGGFDPAHPAVDNNPRANTSVADNKIDMNDPGLSMEEAVAKNLVEGGSGVVLGEAESEAKTETKKD